MSHSSTIRRRTIRRRRRASRIGSPPVRRLPRSVRRRSIRCAVAVASRAAGAPQRRRDLEPRHQPVQPRELVGLERVEALAAQQLLVARRERDRDLVGELALADPDRAGDGDGRRREPSSVVAAARAVVALVDAAARRAAPARSGRRRATAPARAMVARRAPEHTPSNTASKAFTCEGSDTNTARAVQYSRRRETGRTRRQRPRERRRALGAAGNAGVVQPAAERARERRQVEPSVSTRKTWLSHGCSPAARGPPRGSLPGPRSTSGPSRACGRSRSGRGARRRAG